MRQFYPSAGNIGDIQSFWKTLDSVSFTAFVLGKITAYPLVLAADRRI